MTDHHPSALIAEDEPLLAAALQAELARLWPALSVVATVADGASAVTQALALRPSVCFLDIRMPGLSGLEAAQALVEDWPDAGPFPLLVFVTAYDQYAVQAFESQAVDYLLKPVQSQRLAACVQRLQVRLADRVHAPEPMPAQAMPPLAGLDSTLDRTLETLRALLAAHPAGFPVLAAGPHPPQPRLDVIQAGVGSTVHMVPVADVIYFEAADKYVRVVTVEREHLIRLSLRELQPQLDAQLFWQVHRGLVVRASAITTAVRDESGKILLSLRGRSERLSASRLYAHLFKSM